MKKIQHPVAKPLSLAVTAALTGLGLAMTLVTPARADTVVSSSQGSITNTTTQNITITNQGIITAGSTGILNNGGTIAILSNSGHILTSTAGVINYGTISTLTNAGTIVVTAGESSGVGISNGSIIGILSNSGSGSISGSSVGVYNLGTIASLNNNGHISGGSTGIYNNGTIGTLNNTGTIVGIGEGQSAIGIYNGSFIELLNNSGSILGGYSGIFNMGSLGSLNNSGYIHGGASGIFNTSGTISTLSNSGIISGGSSGVGNYGTMGALVNSGTILGTLKAGVHNNIMMGTLNNSGSISGHTNGVYNYSAGTIGMLINTGTITGSTQYGIYNGGTITTLTNGQSNLSYYGNLPTNYNTYFSDSSNYGSTVFFSPSGSISTYGIQLAPTGITLLSNHVYTSVLSSSSTFSVASAYVNTVLTYSANGYSVTYELVPGSGYSYNLDILSFSCSGSCAGSSNSAASGISPAVIAQHNNPAYYAARVIDANSILSNLFSGVSGTAAQSAAASQSLPLVTGGATSVTQTALTSVNTIIDARQSANRGASSGDDFQTSHNMWLKAFGTEADQSDLDGVSGFKAHTGGVTFGADQKINDKLTLGAAFAYANSNVSSTVGGASHGINIKGYQLIGYGSLALNNRDSVDFQLDGGMSNNSGTRDINFADVVANSSYNSWTAHLGSSLNRRYDLSDRLTLTPSLRVDYTRINESGYQESGAGDFDLNVNSQRAEALVFGVDGKLDYKLSDTLALAANLGVGYDAMNKQDSIVAAYAGAPNASFITEGLNQGALISRAGAVLSYKLPKGMEISAHYDVEGRRNYLSQTASVKFSMPF